MIPLNVIILSDAHFNKNQHPSHFLQVVGREWALFRCSSAKSKMDTGWKTRGRGSLDFCLGGRCFPEKLTTGSPILTFIAFLLTSFLKISLGVCCFIPKPLTQTPVCIYVQSILGREMREKLWQYPQMLMYPIWSKKKLNNCKETYWFLSGKLQGCHQIHKYSLLKLKLRKTFFKLFHRFPIKYSPYLLVKAIS